MLGAMLAAAILAQAGPVGAELPITPVGTLNPVGRFGDCVFVDGPDRIFSVYTRKNLAEPPGPVYPYWASRTHGVFTTLPADPDAALPGTPIDLDPVPVDTYTPSVSWNPATRTFLVAFVHDPDHGGGAASSEIYGLILDESGAYLGGLSTPFNIGSDEIAGDWSKAPRIAFDGTDWLVVWSHYASYSATPKIRARFVRGTATNAAPAFGGAAGGSADPIDIAAYVASGLYPDLPVVTFGAGPDAFFVAWADFRFGAPFAIMGGVVPRDGSPPGGIRTYAIEDATQAVGVPTLASNPSSGEFLLAWSSDGTSEGDPFLLRIDPAGVPIGGPVNIDPDPAGRVLGASVTPAWNAAAQQVVVAWWEAPAGGQPCSLKAARLNPDLSVIEEDLDLGVTGGSSTLPFISIASHGTKPQVFVQVAMPGPFTMHARQVELGANPDAPADPVPAQVQIDGATPIPAGGEADPYAFIARSPSADATGGQVRFQVELRAGSDPFRGVPTSVTPPIAAGATASITMALQPATTYRWQARFVDETGLVSAWIRMGAGAVDLFTGINAAPSLSGLEQLGASDGRPLPSARASYETGGIVFRAVATDPDGDSMRVEYEIRSRGTAFRNVATATSGVTADGAIASVKRLFPEGGSFHWQARAVGADFGDASPWTAGGEFTLMPSGSTNGGACSASASGGSAMLLAVLSALAAARCASAGR